MTKLPLLLLLIGVPACAQVPTTTLKSAPIYSHGVPLSLVQDLPHGLAVVSRIRSAHRKRYVQVFLGIHNTGASGSLDFYPGGITLIAGDAGYFLPMNSTEVQEMAKSASRRQLLGAIGIAAQPAFGDAAGTANGPNLEAYKQTNDDLYDAAVEDDADNPATFSKRNLTRTTIQPGEKLEGFLFFDLGKNGADTDSFPGYKLKIPFGDRVYEMDYTISAKAAIAVLAAPPPAAAKPPAVAAVPPPNAKAAAVAPPAAQIGNSTLQVISDPDEADVTLDGKFVGQTPLLLPLAVGDHIVTLTKAGYVSWEKKIHATGARVSIDTELKRSMVYKQR